MSKSKNNGNNGKVKLDVMGSTEVAKALGVQVSNLDTVVGLPDPDARIAAGRIWRGERVRAFAKEYRVRRRRRQRSDRDRSAA